MAVAARTVVEAAPVVVAGTAEAATAVVDTGAAETTTVEAIRVAGTGVVELAPEADIGTLAQLVRRPMPRQVAKRVTRLVARLATTEVPTRITSAMPAGAMSLEVRTALAAATASSATGPPAWIMTGQRRDRNTASGLR